MLLVTVLVGVQKVITTKYYELLESLNELSAEQLNQTVTVYNAADDEYYPVYSCNVSLVDDVLDKDHFFIEIE